MLEEYQWLANRCKEIQLKRSRGDAILDRMNNTLEIMKQKKNELVKPTTVKQTQNLIVANINYFFTIISK